MDIIVSFLEGASFYALFQQISTMSTTHVVMVFLFSKFCFVMMAMSLVAIPPVRTRAQRFLATERTDPARLLLPAGTKALPQPTTPLQIK